MNTNKEFKMTHRFFENHVEFFTEENPPWWLVSKDYKWWYDDYILELEVGEAKEGDFRKIERIK